MHSDSWTNLSSVSHSPTGPSEAAASLLRLSAAYRLWENRGGGGGGEA